MFLIEKGVNIHEINSEKHNALHVLLGQYHHNLDQTLILCRELIERGININQQDINGQVPFSYILIMNNTDYELEKIYELFLEQKELNLSLENKLNKTPIDIARDIPYRHKILKRMEENVK